MSTVAKRHRSHADPPLARAGQVTSSIRAPVTGSDGGKLQGLAQVVGASDGVGTFHVEKPPLGASARVEVNGHENSELDPTRFTDLFRRGLRR